MAHVRLQAIERQQHAPLLQQAIPQSLLIDQPQGQQLFVALHEVGDGALGDVDPPRAERLMDFGNGPMASVAPRPDPRDHIEPEFAVGQCPAALLFWAIGSMIQGASGRLAAADLARQVH